MRRNGMPRSIVTQPLRRLLKKAERAKGRNYSWEQLQKHMAQMPFERRFFTQFHNPGNSDGSLTPFPRTAVHTFTVLQRIVRFCFATSTVLSMGKCVLLRICDFRLLGIIFSVLQKRPFKPRENLNSDQVKQINHSGHKFNATPKPQYAHESPSQVAHKPFVELQKASPSPANLDPAGHAVFLLPHSPPNSPTDCAKNLICK